LTACKTTNNKPEIGTPLPPYPIKGAAVSAELEKHCFPTLLDTKERLVLCPEILKWLNRDKRFLDQYLRAGGTKSLPN
jgi:hypothetical protein